MKINKLTYQDKTVNLTRPITINLKEEIIGWSAECVEVPLFGCGMTKKGTVRDLEKDFFAVFGNFVGDISELDVIDMWNRKYPPFDDDSVKALCDYFLDTVKEDNE